jgi:carbonic anhydrase/acetyltransferase-like protein (isoleucine patch superfamily)
MPGLILPFRGIVPRIAPDAYVAETASVIGDVELGAEASVWFGAVLRGDCGKIRIGARSNVQDNSVIHIDDGHWDTIVGADVLIGHGVVLHGCTVGDGAFIGMKACVMDGAVVEPGAMVAAGALVTPGKVVKSGELWGGNPARLLRPLKPEERGQLSLGAKLYVGYAREFRLEQQARGGGRAG